MFLLAAGIFASCNNNKDKQTGGFFNRDKDDYRNNTGNNDNKNDNKSWSAADVGTFNQQCRDAMSKKGLTDDQLNQVCSCVLEKMEKKYSNMAELDAKGTEEEGREAGQACMTLVTNTTGNNNTNNNNSNVWSSTDEQRFLDDCEGSAKQHVSAERAHQYCDCMLQKSKTKWSSYTEADQGLLKMSKDELDGWVNDCNGGGE